MTINTNNINAIIYNFQIPMAGIGSVCVEKVMNKESIYSTRITFNGCAEGYAYETVDSVNLHLSAFNTILNYTTKVLSQKNHIIGDCGCNFSICVFNENNVIKEFNEEHLEYSLFMDILEFIEANFWDELSNYIP